ncbi:hypothetical protein [Arcicella rigui]|uniref:Uncharacterized protein n=1 Tax=Arcicella rigui TaxID=797020 RepID=A0ABU5QEX5_9BACT|nr:hypothetical protein [Arcicella rigui]MEA5141097.1 hypothetical protein [Arcicella rigui]
MERECIETNDKSIILSHFLAQEFGFELLKVQTDKDCFCLKIISKKDTPNKLAQRLEPVLFKAIEILNYLLYSSNTFEPSSWYFINLHPKILVSNTFLIEVDYFLTSEEIIYFEAYCYDEFDKLVAKAGRMMLRQ